MLSLLRTGGYRFERIGVALQQCAFSVRTRHLEKPMPPRMVIPETDIQESFLKGTGPGGQKINKTSSAVQLKHLPTGLVVKCQETRSRDQNRRTARRILGEKLEDLEKGPLSRTAIKADRAHKKKASATKKARRKHRKLEAEKEAGASDGSKQEEREEIDPSQGEHEPLCESKLASNVTRDNGDVEK